MTFAAVLVRHARARARLGEALSPSLAVRDCETVAQLRELAFASGAGLVVAEPIDRHGSPTWPALAEIRDGFSSLPVVGYCTLRASLSTDVADLARAGVHDFVLLDIDDTPAGLRSKLSKARSVGTAEWAMGELAPFLGTAVKPIVHYCLVNASRSVSVEELSTALGLHRKTLVNRCRDGSLPPPGHIASWGRMLMAARLLEDRNRPFEQIAYELGFTSGASLRHMFKRYLSVGPQEVREAGGAPFVLDALKRTLSAEPKAARSGELRHRQAMRVA